MATNMVPSLSQAPLGLSALDFAQNGPFKAETTSYLQAFIASWNARYPEKP